MKSKLTIAEIRKLAMELGVPAEAMPRTVKADVIGDAMLWFQCLSAMASLERKEEEAEAWRDKQAQFERRVYAHYFKQP